MAHQNSIHSVYMKKIAGILNMNEIEEKMNDSVGHSISASIPKRNMHVREEIKEQVGAESSDYDSEKGRRNSELELADNTPEVNGIMRISLNGANVSQTSHNASPDEIAQKKPVVHECNRHNSKCMLISHES